MRKWIDVITGAAAGGAGVATATGTSQQSMDLGEIEAVAFTFSGTAPATTDLTLTLLGSGGQPDQTVVVRSNSGTPDTLYPRVSAKLVDAASAAITGAWDKIIGSGRLKLDVAQCDNDVVTTARVYFKKD